MTDMPAHQLPASLTKNNATQRRSQREHTSQGQTRPSAVSRAPEVIVTAPTPLVRTLPGAALSATAVVAAVAIYSLLVGLIFFDTLSSMVAIWLRSQTFAHGFLILPISLWLTWRLRRRFVTASLRPQPRALLLVLAAGLLWLGASLVDVQVIQQLAFVAVLVCGLWAIVGTDVARCFAFPLGFLFLAVPMGAGLIPPLMELTADTTEFLLRASGIPVLREGMFLSLPTGNWSVIEECSGVRYLIAATTLGLLYAHLTFHSLTRQLIFVAATIVVSVLANSLRAYGVVMVGHLSEMRYGIGSEHLMYGWVFFALVMLLIFWLGGYWQDQPRPVAASDSVGSVPAKSPHSIAVAALLAVLSAGLWPAVALAMNRSDDSAIPPSLAPPGANGNWTPLAAGSNWHWQPSQPGADREVAQHYSASTDNTTVAVYLHQYLHQRQGVELVTSAAPWRPERKSWRVLSLQSTSVDLGTPVVVDEATVISPREHVLVWSWYRVDDRYTANPYLAKLLEAKQQLIDGHRHGTRIFLATPVGEDPVAARQVLQTFINDYRGAIEQALMTGTIDNEHRQ